MKTVQFTHTVYEKGLAIAHIKWLSGKQEYAVVRNHDSENQCWSHAVRYCKTYQEAKECYVETVNKDRKNRGEKADFYLN